jgi:hypothetical protein
MVELDEVQRRMLAYLDQQNQLLPRKPVERDQILRVLGISRAEYDTAMTVLVRRGLAGGGIGWAAVMITNKGEDTILGTEERERREDLRLRVLAELEQELLRNTAEESRLDDIATEVTGNPNPKRSKVYTHTQHLATLLNEDPMRVYAAATYLYYDKKIKDFGDWMPEGVSIRLAPPNIQEQLRELER